jgi:arylsulfatase A-like enzyme
MQHTLVADKNTALLRMLVYLTSIFVLAQIVFQILYALTANVYDVAVSTSLTFQILASRIFITGMLYFLFCQFLLYTVYVTLIWYLVVSWGDWFALRARTTYFVGLGLLAVSMIAILSANNYYMPHAFFSRLIVDNLFNGQLQRAAIKLTLMLSVGLLCVFFIISVLNCLLSLRHHLHVRRHSIFLASLAVIAGVIFYNDWQAQPLVTDAATAEKPNIIIIGIDAVRPDYLGFYNKNRHNTPHIDAFLRSSTNFAAAYSVLPRTFPSWTTMLTATYPKHNGARGNNTALTELKINDTMPKLFQQAGYQTFYSTDDTRFNNTNELFGFDKIITPPMGLNDFLIGTMNDFPLSNLIIPTPFGRLLFPNSYANHGTPNTYYAKNFLQMLNEAFHQRENKPVFLAVHFTVTHWPFYWFNDKLPASCTEDCRYAAGLNAADQELAAFLTTLQQNKLLDHAIVVLLSDHGISLGMPGDRITTKANYLGDKANMKKIGVFPYAAGAHEKDFYGIDTSFGYGGDILSLKQYHSLLAFKGFGVDLGAPKTVFQRVLLMDIGPTLLALNRLPAIPHADGISLAAYFSNDTLPEVSTDRPFFFESTFSLQEIEKEGISVERVLARAAKLYYMDPKDGLIFVKNSAEKAMSQNKQQGIMQGDWLLARFPSSEHTGLSAAGKSDELNFEQITQPAFMVLVNLKTHQWTTELDTPFAKSAPVPALMAELRQFYGDEVSMS